MWQIRMEETGARQCNGRHCCASARASEIYDGQAPVIARGKSTRRSENRRRTLAGENMPKDRLRELAWFIERSRKFKQDDKQTGI